MAQPVSQLRGQGGQELRGAKLQVPRFRLENLPTGLESVRGYKEIQTFFPSLGKLLNLSQQPKNHIWLDMAWSIEGLDCSGTAGPCQLHLRSKDGSIKKSQKAYLKVTHLLDPIRWVRGEYSLPGHPLCPKHKKTWKTTIQKMTDPWNQAYVEAIASYALGRFREEGISPHFNEFYGAFRAKADTYQYNLTEDYDSYRHSRWFWAGNQKNRFQLRMVNVENPSEPVAEAYLEYLKQPDVLEDSDKESDGDDAADEESDSEEEIDGNEANVELGSIHSGDDGMEEASDLDQASQTTSEDADNADNGDNANDEDDVDTPEHKIYAEISEYPVMLIAIEANDGTLDSLFENIEQVGSSPGTPEWEYKWSAWLFQVLAALSVAQNLLGMTHNDLHTNNIVWTETDQEYLYYTTRDGATFKVPTYGKLFRLIDFGRSIFQVNGTYYISDDFRAGNDADGQYFFKPLHKFPRNEVKPNPSFDLCRLAVSMFDALFPDTPDAKEGGTVLSSEEGFTVNETVSPLFNCIWRWMLDDEGRNVLVNPDGSERFPDFDLYKHIAASVHKAIPAQQFSDPAFDRFQVNPSEVGDTVKKWSLFC